MKRLFLLLFIPLLLSCSNDDSKNQKLDPNAMISIRPAKGTKSTEHLSALEIVKQANNLSFWNPEINPEIAIRRGFAAAQRDTIAPRLLMWGTDIIAQFGNYETGFINGYDMVLERSIFHPEAELGSGYKKKS